MYAVVYRVLGNRGLAEDATQQAFVKACWDSNPGPLHYEERAVAADCGLPDEFARRTPALRDVSVSLRVGSRWLGLPRRGRADAFSSAPGGEDGEVQLDDRVLQLAHGSDAILTHAGADELVDRSDQSRVYLVPHVRP